MRNLSSLLHPRARYPALRLTLCLLCIAVAAGAGWQAWRLSIQAASLQSALSRQQVARNVPPPPKLDKAAVDNQRRWAALAAELSFNWYPIFQALEQTANPDIELLEFIPDKPARRLVLRGEARTVEALIGYQSALAEHVGLGEVYLAHQKTSTRGGMSIVSFEIRAVIRHE